MTTPPRTGRRSGLALALTFALALTACSSGDGEQPPGTVELQVPTEVNALLDPGPVTGQPAADEPSFERSEINIELYPRNPLSFPQDGVPKGQTTKHHLDDSKVYPGVGHDYWVYVPQQYDETQPANLILFQDGDYFLNEDTVYPTTVLDNMIASGDIPPTIAIFVDPGDAGPGLPVYGGDSKNRSVEYDSVDAKYSQFVVDELMPAALDGYNIVDDPQGRIIVGDSSSGNSAFAVAWHRNDQFANVISSSGSFVNIRGGSIWPFAVRTEDKKNIKTFLAVGENDLDILFGDWLAANYDMASALDYKGYDYQLVEGKSGHTLKFLGSFFPEVLQWYWSDGPAVNPAHTVVTSPGEKPAKFGR